MAGKKLPLLLLAGAAVVVAAGAGGKKKNGKKSVVSTGKVNPANMGQLGAPLTPYEWKIEKHGKEFVGFTKHGKPAEAPKWVEQVRGESEEGVRRALIEFIDEQPGFEGAATTAAETEDIVHSGVEEHVIEEGEPEHRRVEWEVTRFEDDQGNPAFVGTTRLTKKESKKLTNKNKIKDLKAGGGEVTFSGEWEIVAEGEDAESVRLNSLYAAAETAQDA